MRTEEHRLAAAITNPRQQVAALTTDEDGRVVLHDLNANLLKLTANVGRDRPFGARWAGYRTERRKCFVQAPGLKLRGGPHPRRDQAVRRLA
ncbi:unannotated protein [freshwater metagenome]|uniref:Unannotated protein n=1 Tax=freshwater metagenome TaxID=449393 RepID=A0A6J5ZS31_9ZZZZ